MDGSGPGGDSKDEEERGWIHMYFVKSICEGAAID